VTLDFGLASSNLSAESKKAWPHEFGLIYSVTLAPGSLQTSLNVRNTGEESIEFQVLLHTYLRVAVRCIPFSTETMAAAERKLQGNRAS
jgi:glucose-6-phosphate 1-epimerase